MFCVQWKSVVCQKNAEGVHCVGEILSFDFTNLMGGGTHIGPIIII